MRRLTAALALSAAAILVATGVSPASADARTNAAIVPVQRVDVQRYLGDWRQIADIPQPYEVFCERDTRANYALNADGTVRVTNTCGGPFGFPITVRGGAKVLDPVSNAQLQVSFLNIFGKQIYDNSGPNYVIIGLADDYSWAVVGSPDRTSGYVLSRTPTLTAAQTTAARAALTRSGFDPCKLTITRQAGGAQTPGPYC